MQINIIHSSNKKRWRRERLCKSNRSSKINFKSRISLEKIHLITLNIIINVSFIAVSVD